MNIEATKLELIKLIADEQSERLLEQVRLFFKKSAKQRKSKAANPENDKAKTASGAGNGSSNSTKLDTEKARNGKFISEDELIELAKMPTPASIDIEQLAKEQNYDGHKLEELMKNWDYSLFEDQSLKELLDSLTP